MKVYTVINKFEDLDTKHIYQENDIYPFDLGRVKKERLEELSGKKNKMKKELIIEKEINDLSILQLIELATIKGFDIKESIIKVIIECNESMTNSKSKKED